MNDTRIRTTIAPNLVCSDGPYHPGHTNYSHQYTIIGWEAPANRNDRRPTYVEALRRYMAQHDIPSVSALCRDVQPKVISGQISRILSCDCAPTPQTRARLAYIIHMEPEDIRWPVHIPVSEEA